MSDQQKEPQSSPLDPAPAPDRESGPDPEATTSPAVDPADEPQQTAAPAPERPLPEYGEYAPEGWVSPVAQAAQPSQGSQPSPGTSSAQPSTPGRLPGVPHNLGVPGASGQAAPPTHATAPLQQPPQAQQPGQPGQPPQAPPAYWQQTQQPTQPYAPQPAQPAAPPKKPVWDRVITIVLLAVGAYMTLAFAGAMLELGQQLHRLAQAAEIEDFTVSSGLAVLENVGAILFLTLFALTLIWSIQRMRRGKLAFWVPLAAAGVSLVLLFVLTTIAMMQSPELVGNLTPETLDNLMQQLYR